MNKDKIQEILLVLIDQSKVDFEFSIGEKYISFSRKDTGTKNEMFYVDGKSGADSYFVYPTLDKAINKFLNLLNGKTKELTATVVYTIQVSVQVVDDASEQEQRQAIYDSSDESLTEMYGNGSITKCSNPDLEE